MKARDAAREAIGHINRLMAESEGSELLVVMAFLDELDAKVAGLKMRENELLEDIAAGQEVDD